MKKKMFVSDGLTKFDLNICFEVVVLLVINKTEKIIYLIQKKLLEVRE